MLVGHKPFLSLTECIENDNGSKWVTYIQTPSIIAAHSARSSTIRKGFPQVLQVVQPMGYVHGLWHKSPGF